MKFKMAMAKTLKTLVIAAPIMYLVLMITIGIMTQVAYTKNGFYPEAESLLDAIRGVELDRMRDVESGWETVAGGPFLYVAAGFFVYGYTMSCILNIVEAGGRGKAKGIIPLLSGVAFLGAMGYAVYAHETHLTDTMTEVQENLMVGIPTLLLIAIAIWSFRKSSGGVYMLITLALVAAHVFILPVILWFAALSTIGKIGAVIAAVIVVGLCFMASIKSGITKREAFAQYMSENGGMSYSDAFDLASDIFPDPDAILPGQ